MQPCSFCALVAGDRPGAWVAWSESAVAFLDHRPLFKGHTLVVPRAHVETLADLPPGQIEPFFSLVRDLSRAVVTGLGAQGSFVAMNNTVSQSVPHLHAHVVPRTKGDGLRGFFWPRVRYEEGEMAEYASRVRAASGDHGRHQGQ
ncbi:MAG TPA: HIT family protein [Ornithinimicrobium sp.]|uniref:HIT family protein n=1 Tax=Ornithinimicrobium sp. TaxID=1977084 RepID=UPI002B47DA3B|nr:HIT family protein [Ornithinimicrobium sp.]HKJ11933.1 HIT family protein [Ornithinimicrobium sp.]